MKYRRLTKEQLEELHPEFINFLASQKITAREWSAIKEQRPEVAEQELDVFSDLIWEGVLNKAQYLVNAAPDQLFLFKAHNETIQLILVKTNSGTDLTTAEGLAWLSENLTEDTVELLTANKAYAGERNAEVFSLIEKGAEITKGELFEALDAFIHSANSQ